MKTHYSLMHKLYGSLLADVSLKSGLSLMGSPEATDEWVLIEAPKLDKRLLWSLENNVSIYEEFPEWLKPLYKETLCPDEGRCAEFIGYLRQVLVFCYKVERDPTHEQLTSAQASFVNVDLDCGSWDQRHSGTESFDRDLYQHARNYISRVISKCNWFSGTPCHGPGAVYPSCRPVSRSKLDACYPSILKYYPLDQWFCGLPDFWSEVLHHGDSGIVEKETIAARLVAVPKDSRGPRLISVHPKEAIWIQQAQRQVLEAAINRSPLTRNAIKFTDQTVNGKLALSSSSDRFYATLDLSEASDRLSCGLVRLLFGDYVYDIISCTRAETVRLLDGSVHSLRKWAPMGNCLTFPVESLCFWALVRASIWLRHGVICDDIHVFGDDIIYPVQYHDAIIRDIVEAGLKPNLSKTFVKGLFRESCGVDAYNGIDVTPVRLRQDSISTIQGAVSLLDLAKRCRLRGYENTATTIYSEYRKQNGKLPLGCDPDCQGLFEYVPDSRTVWLYEPSVKWRKHSQHWAVPIRLVSSRIQPRLEDDWYHLQDSLLSLSKGGESDRGLEYSIPYSTRLSYGWTDVV